MEFDPHTRLAGECLQPLGHLSGPWVGTEMPSVKGAVALPTGSAQGAPSRARSILSPFGRVAERLNAAVLKTVRPRERSPGFESRPFRSQVSCAVSMSLSERSKTAATDISPADELPDLG